MSTEPPLTTELFMQLAFRDGEAYIAPLGTSPDLAEAWKRVDSLEQIAERLRVPFNATNSPTR